MRIPLITPLASRNGTVEKDEKLVNCYGEQDAVTKETRVIKRAGLDEGNAVLTGPDIYGQGLFNYDGYWFAILGDTVFWYDINFTWGGQQAFGSVGFWDSGTAYNLNDPVFYQGKVYYSGITTIGTPPSESDPHWRARALDTGDGPTDVVWGGCIVSGSCSGSPVYTTADVTAWVGVSPSTRYAIYLGPNLDYYGETM